MILAVRDLGEFFGPEVMEAIEEFVDERVREALVAQTQKPWLTVSEAAVYLGCTEAALRKRIARGRVPVRHQGKTVLIDRLLLDREITR